MIDINAILAGAPSAPAPTPLLTQNQQQAQALSLAQMGQNLDRGQMENQQLAQQLRARQALNNAIRANTTVGADGMAAINHDGVVKTLAQTGFGDVANQYRADNVKLQEGLTRLKTEQLQQLGAMQKIAYEAFGSALQVPAGPARQAYWTK